MPISVSNPTTNLLVAKGTTYTTAPTLGNITASKIRVKRYIDINTTGVGTLLGQNSLANREFSLYIYDASAGFTRSIDFCVGGTFKPIGNVIDVFGTATPKGVFEFEYDAATDNWFLKLDDVLKASGNTPCGVARTDGTLWRGLARSNDSTGGSTTGAYIAPAGWMFGDEEVYINDVLVRNYIMPLSGTSITETVSGANATLRGTGIGTGDFVAYVANSDSTPDAGSFGDAFNAALSTLSECEYPVTVSGVDAGVNVLAAPVAGTQICVSTNEGVSYGSWGTASVNVQLGHMIKARKTTSAYNSATVKAGVTIGGVLFEGRITTLATGTFAVKNIVIIGASIEYRPFGQSLTVPHAAGTAALAAAGLPGVNLYGWGHDGFTAAQIVPKIAEAVAAFPYDDTVFLFHPFGNDVSNTRPYSSMTAGEITSFQNNVTNCMAAFGTARNRAYCMGISFRSYANPRTSKAIFNDQSLGSLPYYENFVQEFLLPHELNEDGFPVYDYYNLFRNENETILDNDGIHELNPAGYTRVREFVAQVSKSLFADGVKPAPIVPAPNYVLPLTRSFSLTTVSEGATVLGNFPVSTGTSPTYSISGTNAALFNVDPTNARVTFKSPAAISGPLSFTMTATNALGSVSYAVNFAVVAYVASAIKRAIAIKEITAKPLTAASISARGL